MSTRLAVALIAVALFASPARAWELWRNGEAYLALSGSVRVLPTFGYGTSADAFLDRAENDPRCAFSATFADCAGFDAIGDWFVPASLTRLRLRLDVEVNEHWSGVIVYDNDFHFGRLDTFGGQVFEDIGGDSFLHADATVFSDDHASWDTLLYRGYVFYQSKQVEVVLGRQRIPWGVGRLWNPIDRFNAIPPLALQADQSPGVDALDVRWLFDGFTFLEGVYAPLRDTKDSSYALRLHGVLRDVDYSVVLGLFEEARTAGFDLAGNLLDAAARLEVVYTDPERDVWPIGDSGPSELDDFWQVVVSADYLFDLGSGLYVLVEYLYNGNDLGFGRGKAGPLLGFFESTSRSPVPLPAGVTGPFPTVTSTDRFGGSRVVTRSAHLSGLQLGYDITPELRVDLVSLLDWEGYSASFYPALSYTPRDWLEVTIGAQAFVGKDRSEYGSLDALGFILLEAFF